MSNKSFFNQLRNWNRKTTNIIIIIFIIITITIIIKQLNFQFTIIRITDRFYFCVFDCLLSKIKNFMFLSEMILTPSLFCFLICDCFLYLSVVLSDIINVLVFVTLTSEVPLFEKAKNIFHSTSNCRMIKGWFNE